jgi:Histidine phosphatase superfamily (branch 2)
MSSTFPTNQTLYFDFTHDTNIASVITAFGLTQFNEFLPATGPPANQQMIVSHMEPFGARLTIEVITTPQPVKAARPATNNQTLENYYEAGNATSYVHFTLNQRTIPLNASYTQCGDRDDGWCELGTFMKILDGLLEVADFEYACFANYSTPAYGSITNGVEPRSISEIRSVEEMREVEVRDIYRLHQGMGSGLTAGEFEMRN